MAPPAPASLPFMTTSSNVASEGPMNTAPPRLDGTDPPRIVMPLSVRGEKPISENTLWIPWPSTVVRPESLADDAHLVADVEVAIRVISDDVWQLDAVAAFPQHNAIDASPVARGADRLAQGAVARLAFSGRRVVLASWLKGLALGLQRPREDGRDEDRQAPSGSLEIHDPVCLPSPSYSPTARGQAPLGHRAELRAGEPGPRSGSGSPSCRSSRSARRSRRRSNPRPRRTSARRSSGLRRLSARALPLRPLAALGALGGARRAAGRIGHFARE